MIGSSTNRGHSLECIMADVAIIVNPTAGRGRAIRSIKRLKATLNQHVIHYHLETSKDEFDLRSLAGNLAKDYPTLVGAGGDTTLSIIVDQIIKQKQRGELRSLPALGILPLGSSNDIAREFGIKTLEQACSALQSGNIKKVDVGMLAPIDRIPTYFLGTLSLGLGVTVNKYVEGKVRSHPFLARSDKVYTLWGVRGTFHSFAANLVPQEATIYQDVTSHRIKYALAVFSNIKSYAGGQILISRAKPDDGALDFFSAYATSPFEVLKLFMQVKQGRYPKTVNTTVGRSFRLNAPHEFEVQVDGKIMGPYREITVSAEPRVLPVLVHPGYYGGHIA